MPSIPTRRLACAAAWATLTVLTAPAASAHDGGALFAERCARCHSVDKTVAALKPLGTPEAARARLEALLPRHYAPDHAEHEPIIVYLLSMLAE